MAKREKTPDDLEVDIVTRKALDHGRKGRLDAHVAAEAEVVHER